MSLEATDLSKGRVLRVCWELGLCEFELLVDWADALIARLDAPPYPLIELSLAREGKLDRAFFDQLLGADESASEIVQALALVTPQDWDEEVLCRALGNVQARFVCMEEGLAGSNRKVRDVLGDAASVSDNLYDLDQGYMTKADLRRELTVYFGRIQEVAADLQATP